MIVCRYFTLTILYNFSVKSLCLQTICIIIASISKQLSSIIFVTYAYQRYTILLTLIKCSKITSNITRNLNFQCPAPEIIAIRILPLCEASLHLCIQQTSIYQYQSIFNYRIYLNVASIWTKTHQISVVIKVTMSPGLLHLLVGHSVYKLISMGELKLKIHIYPMIIRS